MVKLIYASLSEELW